MRLLLDTCIIIELITDTGRLSEDVEALLFDADNQLYMSMEHVVHSFDRKFFGILNG